MFQLFYLFSEHFLQIFNGFLTQYQCDGSMIFDFKLNFDAFPDFICEEKIAEDSKWDGLKGYITITDLDAERVIAEYHGLWVVERAFCLSKGTLEMRPMFHSTEKGYRCMPAYASSPTKVKLPEYNTTFTNYFLCHTNGRMEKIVH